MTLLYFYIFLVGLALGSFVNMLVFRTAVAYGLKKGKVRPKLTANRSVCDHCGRKLTVWENIPVISWIWQKGKSRCCSAPLPRQYPVVEIIMGVVAVLSFCKAFETGSVVSLVLMLAVGTLLVFQAVFDANYMILPDWATGVLAGLVIVNSLIGGQSIGQNLVGAGVGLLIIGGVWLITKGRGMGLGDVKLMPVLGWWLGGTLSVVSLYLAFIGGAVVGVALLVTGRVKRRQPIPFGPFLLGGAWISWWGGEWWRQIIEKFFSF